MSPVFKLIILGTMLFSGIGTLPAIGLMIYMQMADDSAEAERRMKEQSARENRRTGLTML